MNSKIPIPVPATASAYDTDAATTARVPATAHASTSGWAPVSTPTPTSPSTIPTIRIPVARSLCASQIARTATNSGTVALAIAATPESMCFCPQAISVNGAALLMIPSAKARHPARPSRPRIPRAAINPTRKVEAITRRPAISVVGSRSRSAISMNMYEAPQIAASERIRVMSVGFVIAESQTMTMPAALLHGLLRQLIVDVEWGPLDYLVIDLPPGTADLQQELVRLVPEAAAIVVVGPQDVAHLDGRKLLDLLRSANVRVLGAVENMATSTCPHC